MSKTKIFALQVFNYNEYNDDYPKIALIEVNQELIDRLTELKNAWDNLPKHLNFSSLNASYFVSWMNDKPLPCPEHFHVLNNNLQTEDDYADIASDYGFITDLKELESERVDSTTIVINHNGFKFKCYNHYNSDSYDTDTFTLETLTQFHGE